MPVSPAVHLTGALRSLRRALYGSRERIAGTVYGTIVLMGVLAAGSERAPVDAWELDLVMVGTVVVLWIAHVYSHALADSLSTRAPIDRRSVVVLAREESSIVLAAAAPALALLLGAVGVVPDLTAVWIALGLGTITLGVQGLRYARVASLDRRGTIAVVGVNLALGLVIVGLKAIVSH
jgi:hypothetical protein